MILRFLALILLSQIALAVQPIALDLSSFHDSPRVHLEQNKTLKISPGGGISLRAVSPIPVPATHTVLEFESFSLGALAARH